MGYENDSNNGSAAVNNGTSWSQQLSLNDLKGCLYELQKELRSRKELLIPTFVGAFAFGSTLATSTLIQQRLLRISTGTRPRFIPSSVGILSVSAASLASHYGAIYSYGATTSKKETKIVDQFKSYKNIVATSIEPTLDMRHSLRVAFVGLIVFKLMAGRFWAVAPSSFTSLGSFARASLPASSNSYASSSQRAAIERIGSLSGCHTCGSRMMFSIGKKVSFHADHMPPNAVVKQMNENWFRKKTGMFVKQRFYPQCTNCSGIQGGILASASNELKKFKSTNSFAKLSAKKPNLWRSGGGKLAHFHGLRFRISHLTGAVIAGLTVYDATPKEIEDGNKSRFSYIEETIRSMCDRAQIFCTNQFSSDR